MFNTNEKFIDIIKKNNIIEIQKFYNEKFSWLNETTIQLAFIKAVDNDDKKTAKWLLKNIKNVRYVIKNAFIITCEKGNLYLSQWLYNIKKDIDDESCCQSFKLACLHNKLEIIIWLYSTCSNIKNQNFDSLFTLCCENNNLEIIKWLYKISPKINISKNNEYIFCTACYNGHFEQAKWLLEIKPDIDINYDKDYAFRAACQNSYIEIAKLVYNHKKNINNDIINIELKNACFLGKYDLTAYLIDILPIINVKYFDDEIVFKYACEKNLIDLAKVFTKFFKNKYFFEIIDKKINNWSINGKLFTNDNNEIIKKKCKVNFTVKNKINNDEKIFNKSNKKLNDFNETDDKENYEINNKEKNQVKKFQNCCNKNITICNICKIDSKLCEIKNWPFVLNMI